MNKKITLIMIGMVVAAIVEAQNASVSWSTGAFPDDSVLSTVAAGDALVYAVNLGGNTGQGTITTGNGYAFEDYHVSTDLTLGSPNIGGIDGINFLSGGVGSSSDVNFNTILGSAWIPSGANSVTFDNLTVGQQYVALFLVADSRTGGEAGRTFTITGGGETSPSQTYAFVAGTPDLGGYAAGTFTADATTEAFTDNNNQLNDVAIFSVSEVPEPSTWAFMLTAMVSFVPLKRKFNNFMKSRTC